MPPKAKKKKSVFQSFIQKLWLFLIIILIGLILFLSQDINKEIGLSQSPDAVIVLGGGNGTRVKAAVTLINHFPKEPVVFFTGGDTMFGKSYTLLMKEYAQSLKLNVKNIHMIDTSMSTFDDASHLKNYLQENNITINRLLVITSKYHTGRSYWVFQKVFENSKVEIGIIGSNDYIDYSRWWFDYNMSEIILLEKARFLLYRLVGLINPSIMDV